MKKVYDGFDLAEVHILKGILDSYGIESKVEDDQLLGLVGGVGYTEAVVPTVWIFDDTRYDEALAIVKEYEEKRSSTKDVKKWTCSVCQEEIEEQFTECWKCNSSRELKSLL